MKIKKIECPSCGYSFNLDNIDKNKVCQCPACKSSLYIDDEKELPSVVNININNYGNNNDYTQYQQSVGSKSKIKTVIPLIILIVAISFYAVLNFTNTNTSTLLESSRTTVESEPVIRFVESIFSKDLANITSDEYSQIAYLHIERNCPSDDWTNADSYPWRFDYAFSVDSNGEPIECKSKLIYSNNPIEKEDIQAFLKIVNVKFGEYGSFIFANTSSENIKFSNLENLKHYGGGSFTDIAKAFKDPSKIESIHVDNFNISDYDKADISEFTGLKNLSIGLISQKDSLKELSKLSNLESLKIDFLNTDKNTELSFLTSLTKLKVLEISLSSDTSISNSDILYGLPNLEKLSLKGTKNIKSIEFVKNMPKLYSLELDDAPILDINPLSDKISLTELYLEDLDYVKDLSVIKTLSSLKKLKLVDIDAEPSTLANLSNLTSLKDVEIDGDYINSLSDMNNIEHLISRHYFSSSPSTISTLTNLKSLEIDLSGDIDNIVRNISMHPNIKSVKCNLNSVSAKYYITDLFNSKNIKDLIIDNSYIPPETIYIDFDSVKNNTSLKSLTMNNSEIIDINGNNEKLGEFSDDFLSKFTALEILCVRENNIKSLEFVKSMPNLELLDIGDNFVTDVNPLITCKSFKSLICDKNSINNLNVLPENIEVIKD